MLCNHFYRSKKGVKNLTNIKWQCKLTSSMDLMLWLSEIIRTIFSHQTKKIAQYRSKNWIFLQLASNKIQMKNKKNLNNDIQSDKRNLINDG